MLQRRNLDTSQPRVDLLLLLYTFLRLVRDFQVFIPQNTEYYRVVDQILRRSIMSQIQIHTGMRNGTKHFTRQAGHRLGFYEKRREKEADSEAHDRISAAVKVKRC